MYEPTKEKTKELYTKIWIYHIVSNQNLTHVAEKFGCSVDTVMNALNYCAEELPQLKTTVLLEGAKESVRVKLRGLEDDITKIKGQSKTNWNAILGLHRLIKEYKELLWKLESVIQDRSIVTINSTQVNQVLKARDEAEETLSDEERKNLTCRIREAISQP